MIPFLKPFKNWLIKMYLKYDLLRLLHHVIFKRKFITSKFISNENFVKILNQYGKVACEHNRELYYTEMYTVDRTSNHPILNTFKSKNSFYGHLKNVTIIGTSSVILLPNRNVLYEPYLLHDNGNIKFSDISILFSKGALCFIGYFNEGETIEHGIMLSGNFSSNYFHLMFELVAKFQQINKLKIAAQVPLLIDEQSLKYPQYRSLINIFNTTNRIVLPIKQLYRYKIKNLYYVSCPHFIAPNFKDITRATYNCALYDFENLLYIRQTLLQHKLIQQPKKSKVFISRKNVSNHRSYNELDVQNFLIKEGFQIVFPENHTLQEQVTIFNDADIIVGATGAAFSNLLFCKKECKVVCLLAVNTTYSLFATIAAMVGFNITYLNDSAITIQKNTHIQTSFNIKIDELSVILKGYNNE